MKLSNQGCEERDKKTPVMGKKILQTFTHTHTHILEVGISCTTNILYHQNYQ